MFGIMERQLDNVTLLPIIGARLPAYTTEGLFLLDAGGKAIDFIIDIIVVKMKSRNVKRWRSIKEVFIVLLMIAPASTFWSLVVVGVLRLFFELSERVAVMYIGGAIFLSLSLMGVLNYKKIAIYVK